MVKKFIQKNKKLYKFLSDSREILRIIYNTKTRSRFFWLLRKGDDNLSLDYPLEKNSIIFDIGAYEGNFTKKIYHKFNCKVYAFEPLEEKALNLKKYFNKVNNVKVYSFGLLSSDKQVQLSNIEAGSSIFSRAEGDLDISVNMKSFYNFVLDNSIEEIDLMYMNIDGSEYELLEHIIECGYIKNIKHLQVQFHNFVENSKVKRKDIRKKLKTTHKCKFNYPFIWERWDIKL